MGQVDVLGLTQEPALAASSGHGSTRDYSQYRRVARTEQCASVGAPRAAAGGLDLPRQTPLASQWGGSFQKG